MKVVSRVASAIEATKKGKNQNNQCALFKFYTDGYQTPDNANTKVMMIYFASFHASIMYANK